MSPDNQTKSAIEGTETSPPHVLLHLQTSPRMCHSRKKAATHLRRESREDLLVHAAASLTGLHNPSQFRPCLCPRELLLRMVWQEPEKLLSNKEAWLVNSRARSDVLIRGGVPFDGTFAPRDERRRVI